MTTHILGAVGATDDEISLLFVLLALLCLAGAAYCAYLRNVLGAGLLVLVAVVAFVLGT